MTKARRITCLIAAAAALSLTSLLPAGAAVAGIKPPVATTTVQVVATGLNVPRGLVYDPANQRLLIAEAGVAAGNTGPCTTGDDGNVCYGATGSIYSFSLNGGQSGRVITGLPSFSDTGQFWVKGLEDLSLFGGQLSGAFSLSGTPATRTALGPGAADLGQAVTFGKAGVLGKAGSVTPVAVTPVADVATEETRLYNADMTSDPFGVATGSFGTLIANADGTPGPGSNFGGNDVLQLKDGNLTQLAAFPARVPAANPNDLIESVPTTVEQGPDGAFYVGELTSFPFYQGEARIWRVVPGQAPTVFASGFTKINDMAFDPSGRLLILQCVVETGNSTLIRLNKDGTQTLLATGMTNPGGIAVIDDHTFYVTNNSGGTGGDGELLKITVTN